MDWLVKHCPVLDCYSNTFTCLDGEENSSMVQGILRPTSVKDILTLQMKEFYKRVPNLCSSYGRGN